KSLLFLADQNGDEQNQVYLMNVSTGDIMALTANFEVQYYLGEFSPDGKKVAFAGNDRVPTEQDVIIYDLASGERTTLTGIGILFAANWSPNGRYMTVLNAKSNTNVDVMLYDVQTGELTNLIPHDDETIYAPGPWAHDSSGFYLMTNVGREFTGMGFYKIQDKTWEWVETPDHDIENVVLAHNAPVLVWSVNDNGASKLFACDLNTHEALNMPKFPVGVIGGINIAPSGDRLALVFARPGEASNLYEFNLKTGELKALGQSMLGRIDPADMVEPELVYYETFDGRKIPAWLYKPKVGVGQAPYPVVLSIHGGPEAQERPGYAYSGFYQYLLNRGFGVLAPNIRGSTGYGITYQKLIHRDWGGAELKDIEHAAKYLQSLDWVDNNRLAVYGGSFGGFATLSAITRLPQYWACAVDLVGPANLLTFVKAVPPTWRRIMKEWVGDPEEDYDLLVERSPITYVDQIRAPLLVIQGANDPRVVKAESDQMVERIRSNGGSVKYYVD
ncbi:MAG TPA: prolyl oligopeptidase family serine peptidase, partial [Phototrophicaceae bacterium]|nr:prolyl oligopeptidase family serine peptidase [Phototrophicaceae bacterium]